MCDRFFSSSQQTKRKLDDANKRLEALYDKLREQTVSLPPRRRGNSERSSVAKKCIQIIIIVIILICSE